MSGAVSPRKTEMEDFARYEFKYLLDAARRTEIETEVSHFMDYDGHVHPELGNCYFVRSLYFDNMHATNFYEKIDGMKERRKYRIRTYAKEQDDSVPTYLEEKGRHNERTYKHRVPIDHAHLPIFCTPERHFELIEKYPETPLVEQFVYDCARRTTLPRVLVDYLRRPYTSQFDLNFRLTFDSDLRATSSGVLFPHDEDGWRQVDAGFSILEVKFHRRIPAWFHRILQAHDMRRLSISKFCRGMESCGLAVDLS
jgi:hypothetical protein